MFSSQDLDNVVKEYISDFISKQNLSYVVKNSIPVVWFGDIEKYKVSDKKILTIAINPSFKEFEESRFSIVDLNENNAVCDLKNTLNSYFEYNPYSKWFENFEKVLNCFGASYYKKKKTKNVAIHIDIYSAIATDPTWRDLSSVEQNNIQRIDLFKKLFDLLDPDVILFSVNQKVFEQIFSKYHYVKSANIVNKKAAFIKKYEYEGKILFNGRNLQGQPFGGLKVSEIKKAIKELLCGDENVDVDVKRPVKSVINFVKSFFVSKPKNKNSVVSEKEQSNKISDNTTELESIKKYVWMLRGYACSDWKVKYFVAVLDILRTNNRPMSVDEVRYQCFINYSKYGIKEDKDSRKIIYECLYQHADCNNNSNAKQQSIIFTRDNSKRYVLNSGIRL